MLTFNVSSKCSSNRNVYTPDSKNTPRKDTGHHFNENVITQNRNGINPAILRCPVTQVCEDTILGIWYTGRGELDTIIIIPTVDTLPTVSSVIKSPGTYNPPRIQEGVFPDPTSGHFLLYSKFQVILTLYYVR